MRHFTFVVALCIFSLSSFAQKRVLIEKFTSAFCGSCPNASIVIDELRAEYDLIWVNHHKLTTWTDYQLDNDQSPVLWDDSQTPGTPTAMVDRVPLNNALATTLSSWETRVLQRIDEPAYADISIDEGAIEPNSRLLQFTVSISFDELPTNAASYRLSAMMVEDSIVGYGQGYDQSNYFNEVEGHPLQGLGQPIVGYVHNNVVRAILDEAWGNADIIPANPEVGTTYSHTFSYTVPEQYHWENMRAVIVLAQHDTDDVRNRQVLNANERQLSDFVATIVVDPANETLPLEFAPNPANDFIQIDYHQLPSQGAIYNAQGQLVESINVNDTRVIHPIHHLDQGTYLLRFLVGDQWYAKKLLIVR